MFAAPRSIIWKDGENTLKAMITIDKNAQHRKLWSYMFRGELISPSLILQFAILYICPFSPPLKCQ